MISPNSRLALYAVLIFVSGAALGAIGHQYFTPAPASANQYRSQYMQEMKTRLKLSPEQARQVETILDETRAKYRELRERHRPEMQAIQEDQTSRVNAMLSAEQQAEYALLRKEREERRKAQQSQK
jgi:hypothetical protein